MKILRVSLCVIDPSSGSFKGEETQLQLYGGSGKDSMEYGLHFLEVSGPSGLGDLDSGSFKTP